jgi:hypothetical protein
VARTGPKISSRAIVISGVTSSNTVGCTKYPGSSSATRAPPATIVAPSRFPVSMYPSTVSICFSETIAPIRVVFSNGSPTVILPAPAATAGTSSSCAARSTRSRLPAAHTSPLP